MRGSSILLFGDGTVNPVSTIRQLGQDAKRIPSLQTLLRDCAAAIRSEIESTTLPARTRLPKFSSILDLNEIFANSDSPDILTLVVLLCVAQLGALLRACELDVTILQATQEEPLYCVALCSGMIPATAAACCSSPLELLQLAPEITRINVRMMLALTDRSATIEDLSGTWTVITPELRSQDHDILITNFTAAHNLPVARWPYVSAESETVTTISGPPSSLDKYFDSCDKLRQTKKIPTDINTACHAPHIKFDDLDVIVGDNPVLQATTVGDNVIVFSIDTGKPIKTSSLVVMLRQCLDEVFNHRFRWDRVTQELRQLTKTLHTHVRIFPLGPDRVSSSVVRMLQGDGIDVRMIASQSVQDVAVTSASDDVAIVGVSGRLPGGAGDLVKIWQCLREGKDTHTEVPGDRFSLDTHYDPSGETPNTVSSRYGCFIDNPGHFDVRLFKMSSKQARQTDPMQRLVLMTTYEALEMAGYSPNTLPCFTDTRIGTFFGQTVDDYRETNASQNIDAHYVSGGVRAFGPGRLNYHYKWEGPSMSIDTACSSSAVAIQLAFKSLQSGECDLAVAGGMNIITGPDMYAGLSRGGFLSKTGNCKTLDLDADGYCRGEGIGTVILKRLSDAMQDNDNILAVIKAVATNHSAYATSITRPDVGAQVTVMRRLLSDTGIDARDIDYIEMHGTGTQAGDAAELESISQAFCRDRTKQSPLYIGSAKANFGHGEAAAGTNSLLKILLMLQHNAIPPHIGIKKNENPLFTKARAQGLDICEEITPLVRAASRPRRIVLNSFNASGGNTALLLEDAPVRSRKRSDPRSTHIVVVSGHTLSAIETNRKKLLGHIQADSRIHLASLAFTTTARRLQHKIRKAYITHTITDLIKQLSTDLETPALPTGEARAVFVFTGQGSHHVEVAHKLMKVNSMFRRLLKAHDNVCRNHGVQSFMPLLEKPDGDFPQSVVQTSIVAIQIALVCLLRAWGISPAAVIGHSIGEYAALYAANVLAKSDALYLAATRAMLMDELCQTRTQSMLAVCAQLEKLREVLMSDASLHDCTIACYNGPSSHVVSGSVEALARLKELLGTNGIMATMLDVAYGFHSAQMHEVASRLKHVCAGIPFQEPTVPIASTLLGTVVNDAATFKGDYLARQTQEPVRFSQALRALYEHLGTAKLMWIEIGTHPICGSMITSTLSAPEASLQYLLKRGQDPAQSISRLVSEMYTSGTNVCWSEYHKEYRQHLELCNLPAYAFDLDNYWIPYANDWRLHKGAQQSILQPMQPEVRHKDPSLAPFHYLLHENLSGPEVAVHLSCTCDDRSFADMISGHLVDTVALCPSSVYADLGYHAAAQLWARLNIESSDIAMLKDVDILSPYKLSPTGNTPDLSVIASAQLDLPEAVSVRFVTMYGAEEVVHARCIVQNASKDDSAHEKWQENHYLIDSRIKLFSDVSMQDSISFLQRAMIYRLFASSIVDYGKDYHLCQNIRVDYAQHECVATLQMPHELSSTTSPGPHCLDALIHTAGFVLNSNPHNAPDACFISSGWAALHILEELKPGATYMCHSRMFQQGTSNVYLGNVTVLTADRVISVCRGVKFHKLTRRSLHKLLGVASQSAKHEMSQSLPQTLQSAARSITTPKPSSPPVAQLQQNFISKSAEDMIADLASELDVSVGELHDTRPLAELGIDSLHSIALLAGFEKRRGISLPADIFAVCETIGELKKTIQQNAPAAKANVTSSLNVRSQASISSAVPVSSVTRRSALDAASRSAVLCRLIAAELDLSEDEVKTADNIQDLGIDSIVTLTILDRFRKQTGSVLQASIFADHQLLSEVFKGIDYEAGPGSPDDSSSERSTSDSTALTSDSDDATVFDVDKYSCTPLLLRGPVASTQPALFLLPDGSGSLFSYIHIPEIKSGLRVYALDSPFHKNPDEFNITFAQVAEIYVREIRRIQPQGPYLIAGWSLGGVHAFEVSRQLINYGEEIKQLIMMDSPCPGILPPLPNASLDLLEKAGVFQGLSKTVGKVALHTRTHFVKITSAFNRWPYKRLNATESSRSGRVSIIWAQSGVLEDDEAEEEAAAAAAAASNALPPEFTGLDADMMRAKRWLCGKRSEFGDNGWQDLVGKDVHCYTVPGNHFSMVFPPLATALAKLLGSILSM